MSALKRILKLAEILYKESEEEYNKALPFLNGYIKKCAHFAPMSGPGDYDFTDEINNVPWSGSMSDFLKRFPNGFTQWRAARDARKEKAFNIKNDVMITKNEVVPVITPKVAHYEPKNDSTPNPWRKNMDYADWENSPYFGSMTEFMKKFPGGIEDWRKWKEKTKKQRFKKWDIKKRKAELEQLMKQAEEKFSGYTGSIEKDTLKNKSFRKVIFTGKHEQLVLMTLQGGEDIGEEIHKNVDQFFRVEAGEAIFELNGSKKKIGDGGAVLVPAGTRHNVRNASDSELLQLYTIYSPPNHPDGEVQKTKEEAIKEEEKKSHKMKTQKSKERRAKLELLVRKAEGEKPDIIDVSDLPDTGTSPERRKEFQHAIADIEESKLTPDELEALLRVLKSQEKEQNTQDVKAHYEPETLEFVKLTGPKEWVESVKGFIKKRKKKDQSAEDAAYEAARDFVKYYKILLKRKKNGKA